MRHILPVLLLLPLAAGAEPHGQAPAPPVSPPLAFEVTPACCTIGFTAYVLGIFPIEGRFGAFAGRLALDAGNAHAEARIETGSLTLDGGPIEEDVKSPGFLDVEHYRSITFNADGIAAPDLGSIDTTLTGMLTIKGVTHPVVLTVRHDEARVTAEARISRRAWGITARPVLAGDTIAIRITMPLPH